ncbi:MAG: hypothetical protein E6R07_09000 [Nevskiaceae bacterium]|nr:MAG: hypothetical protein E6R07_09000 [Nevskiaceae bacterium]
MLHDAVMLLLTALCSSLLTWMIAGWFYKSSLEPRLDKRLEQIQIEFEARVKSGVTAAALDLLPELRKQVAQGFTDAMSQSRAAGLVEDTAKMVSASAGLGAGIVESGLNALFGVKPGKR